MNPFTFSLEALDEVVSLQRKSQDDIPVRLLEFLRNRLSTDEELQTSEGVPSEKVIESVIEEMEREDLADAALRLETLRNDLNSRLLKMSDEGQNPSGFLVDEHFRFIQLTRRKFQPSELAFRLPQTLHGELKDKLEILETQTEEESKKLGDLERREKEISKTQLHLENEKTEKRTDLKEQVSGLMEALDHQRQAYEKEISRLQKEIDQYRELSSASLDNKEENLVPIVDTRTHRDEGLNQRLPQIEDALNNLNEKRADLAKQEKELIHFKNREKERVKKRENYLKKSADAHLERIRTYDQRLADISQQERERRKQQEEEFKAKIQELQQDFRRQLIHFQMRANEDAEHSKKMEEERHELMLKRQALSGEIQSRTEEYLKKRQEELRNREARMESTLKQASEMAAHLNREKQTWLKTMKTESGTLYLKAELESLFEDQTTLSAKLKTLTEKLGAGSEESGDEEKARLQYLEQAAADELKIIQEEREHIKETMDELITKKNQLIERETQELARLHEDYEDLRLSLEVSQIEKTELLDQREQDVQQREIDLQDQFQEYQSYRDQCRKNLRTQEEQIQTELENLLSARVDLDAWTSEARQFFSEFQASFSRRLEVQKGELEIFRNQVEDYRESTDRLRQTLENEAQTSKSSQSKMEQTLEERISQHQQLMDSLENELQSRIEEYRRENKTLQESRREIHKRDQDTMQKFLDNLNRYEKRLHDIGLAFEELSQSIEQEQALGDIQIVPDKPVPPEREPVREEGFSETKAQDEWEILLHLLNQNQENPIPEIATRYIDEWAKRFELWEDIQAGEFYSAEGIASTTGTPKHIQIDHSFRVGRFPITNLEFMRFVLATGYRTEAESGEGGIVYFSGFPAEDDADHKGGSNPTLESIPQACWWRPDGSPEGLKNRASHPVTLISWKDAQAYCQWKSEQTGTRVRLPKGLEWEYLASNLGNLVEDLPWEQGVISQFCNIEESRIGSTTPVDHFPTHDHTAGVLDLFGNVYEWVEDGEVPAGRSPDLDYRFVRGGSFLTQVPQLARWRRLPFLSSYRTSFIGFRTVSEPESATLPES